MKWYTLIMNKPEGNLKERFANYLQGSPMSPLYDTSQVLVWDGPANKRNIVALYHALQPYARGIILSSGKLGRGKTVLSDGKWD